MLHTLHMRGDTCHSPTLAHYGGAVQEVLKQVQNVTRLVHCICAESKARKDPSITKWVPAAKRVLESFVVAMAGVSKALGAEITIGNLKHKDLAGNEVGSQVWMT